MTWITLLPYAVNSGVLNAFVNEEGYKQSEFEFNLEEECTKAQNFKAKTYLEAQVPDHLVLFRDLKIPTQRKETFVELHCGQVIEGRLEILAIFSQFLILPVQGNFFPEG